MTTWKVILVPHNMNKRHKIKTVPKAMAVASVLVLALANPSLASLKSDDGEKTLPAGSRVTKEEAEEGLKAVKSYLTLVNNIDGQQAAARKAVGIGYPAFEDKFKDKTWSGINAVQQYLIGLREANEATENKLEQAMVQIEQAKLEAVSNKSLLKKALAEIKTFETQLEEQEEQTL